MNSIMSIYIPRIHNSYDENYINSVMQFFMIGTVKRVDFCAIEGIEDYCSAFIHFMYYMDNSYVYEMLISLEQGHSQKLQIAPKEYWILLKNNNPVTDTRLNIHQVVENARLLEEHVLSLESSNLKQEQQIFDLQGQVNRLEQTLSQLMNSINNIEKEDKDLRAINWEQQINYKGQMMMDELEMNDEDSWCDGHWSQDEGKSEKEDIYADMPPLIPIEQEECMQVQVVW